MTDQSFQDDPSAPPVSDSDVTLGMKTFKNGSSTSKSLKKDFNEDDKMLLKINSILDKINILEQQYKVKGDGSPTPQAKCTHYDPAMIKRGEEVNIRDVIDEVKTLCYEFEIYTNKYLESEQTFQKYFDPAFLKAISSGPHEILLKIIKSIPSGGYSNNVFAMLNLVDKLITLLTQFFDCSQEWIQGRMYPDEEKNLFMFLDLLDHHATYLITLDMFFKNYSESGNIKSAMKWKSKPEIEKRAKLMNTYYNGIVNPESKNKPAASSSCVIS